MPQDTKGPPEPAAQDPNLEEWIYTFSSRTGEVLKVERVDVGSGTRQELPDDEYRALSASPAYEEGYLQGIADFAATIGCGAGQNQMSSVEAAYYQGMADYAAALGV
jgi:hypothetical protein